jgi:hypothetical protein
MLRQEPARAFNCSRIDAGIGRERDQEHFIAAQVVENPDQKALLRGRLAQISGIEAGKGEEAAQALGLAGDEFQGRDGEILGVAAGQSGWHGHARLPFRKESLLAYRSESRRCIKRPDPKLG